MINLEKVRNFLFHPLAQEHSTATKHCGVITTLVLTLVTRGFWLIPFTVINFYDRFVKKVGTDEDSPTRRTDAVLRQQIPSAQQEISAVAPSAYPTTNMGTEAALRPQPLVVSHKSTSSELNVASQRNSSDKVDEAVGAETEQFNELINKAGQMKGEDLETFLANHQESFDALLRGSKNSNYLKRTIAQDFKDLPLWFFLRILLSKTLDFNNWVFMNMRLNAQLFKDSTLAMKFISPLKKLDQRDFERALNSLKYLDRFKDCEEFCHYVATFLEIEEWDSKDLFLERFSSRMHLGDFVDKYGKFALLGLRIYYVSNGNKFGKWDDFIDAPDRLNNVLKETEEDLIQFALRESEDNNELHRLLLMFDNGKLSEVLEQGGKVLLSQTSLGNTPLHLGCKTANSEAVLSMLGYIEDPNLLNKPDEAGMTPLHWASFFRMDDVITLLINKGADPKRSNPQGQKPVDLYKLNINGLSYHTTEGDAKLIADGRTMMDSPLEGITDILFHMDMIASNYLGLGKREILFSITKRNSAQRFLGYYQAYQEQFIKQRKGIPPSQKIINLLSTIK